MTEYAIKLTNGHVLINDGEGWLLVDTGSQYSFRESGHILLDGDYPVPRSYSRADADYVSAMVGERVGGLIGMDILGRYGFKIDIPSMKFTVGCSTEGLTLVPSLIRDGRVIVEMTINGFTAKLLLDSGAPISYVFPRFTEELVPVGKEKDFSPMLPGDGTFETPIFEFSAVFAGKEFMMKAGHLPPRLESQVASTGCEGAVGLEITRRFPIVIADGGVWI